MSIASASPSQPSSVRRWQIATMLLLIATTGASSARAERVRGHRTGTGRPTRNPEQQLADAVRPGESHGSGAQGSGADRGRRRPCAPKGRQAHLSPGDSPDLPHPQELCSYSHGSGCRPGLPRREHSRRGDSARVARLPRAVRSGRREAGDGRTRRRAA